MCVFLLHPLPKEKMLPLASKTMVDRGYCRVSKCSEKLKAYNGFLPNHLTTPPPPKKNPLLAGSAHCMGRKGGDSLNVVLLETFGGCFNQNWVASTLGCKYLLGSVHVHTGMLSLGEVGVGHLPKLWGPTCSISHIPFTTSKFLTMGCWTSTLIMSS